jgi:hypothetical protein
MKKVLLCKYYSFLVFIEDIFCDISTYINNHRKRIDAKYWHKYLR